MGTHETNTTRVHAGSPAHGERWLVRVEARAEPARLGGKARSLQRLQAIGLTTPAAFVVTDEVVRALLAHGAPAEDGAPRAIAEAPWPPGFAEALASALSAVEGAAEPQPTTRWAVRSSFAHEDDAEALAAGIYASELPVARAEVPNALRRVWASAFSPGARAYAARTERPVGEPPLAILVHPFVAARANGSVAFAPDHGEVTPLIDLADANAESGPPRSDADAAMSGAARWDGKLASAVAEGARRAAARWGAVDLEWAATAEGDVVFLQARPDTRPMRSAPPPPPWQWDAAHNPRPLSPAQAGLVADVNAHLALPFRMQVWEGYLFYAPHDGHAPQGPSFEQAVRAWHRWVPDFLARLDAWPGSEAAPTFEALTGALALYREGYLHIFGCLQPAVSRQKDELRGLLSSRDDARAGDEGTMARLLHDVPSLATLRRQMAADIARAATTEARTQALASYLRAFGDEGPEWDVAEPTWCERPRELLHRVAPGIPLALTEHAAAPSPAAETQRAPAVPTFRDATPSSISWSTLPASARLGPLRRPESVDEGWLDRCLRDVARAEPRPALAAVVSRTREAVALGEADDAVFARLQALVRRALLARGQALVARGRLSTAADIFFLSWPDELEAAYADDAGIDLIAGAAHRREAQARGARRPPVVIAPDVGTLLHGKAASPGRLTGRVARPGAPRSGMPRVLVASTLLPTELPLIDAEALVVETGGPLGHVAAQARERGIPAIVSLPGATRLLREGQRVLVDGDRGEVTVLGPLDEDV